MGRISRYRATGPGEKECARMAHGPALVSGGTRHNRPKRKRKDIHHLGDSAIRKMKREKNPFGGEAPGGKEPAFWSADYGWGLGPNFERDEGPPGFLKTKKREKGCGGQSL